MQTINQAVKFMLDMENINTKKELNNWCGVKSKCGVKGRKKLYKCIEQLVPQKWKDIENPEASVRFNYQKILSGYKISNKKHQQVRPRINKTRK